MKLSWKFRLLICAISLLPAASYALDEAPRRLALVIGNWDYNLNHQYDALPDQAYARDLHNPCHDADLIKSRLTARGFAVHDLCNVTREGLDQAIATFHEQVSGLPAGSLVFVYYSGHGLQHRGRVYLVPVLFKQPASQLDSERAKFRYLLRAANDLNAILSRLPDQDDIGIIVSLDNCRDDMFEASEVYSEFVSIRTAPNVLIQYATTAGDQASDGNAGDHSPYARTLAAELARNQDIVNAMARTNIGIWRKYKRRELMAYAETNMGPAFSALKLASTSPEENRQNTAAEDRKNIEPIPAMPASMGRVDPPRQAANMKLAIFWCEGPHSDSRRRLAMTMRDEIHARRAQYGLKTVEVRPLSEKKNNEEGYNVRRNIMRYDVAEPGEKALLTQIALDFPEGNFLPQKGTGFAGHTTPHYVSAFVCADVDAR